MARLCRWQVWQIVDKWYKGSSTGDDIIYSDTDFLGTFRSARISMDGSSDQNERWNWKLPTSTRSDASVQSFLRSCVHTFVWDLSLSNHDEIWLSNSVKNNGNRWLFSCFVFRCCSYCWISTRGTWLNWKYRRYINH